MERKRGLHSFSILWVCLNVMEVPTEWKGKMAMVETTFPMFLDLGSDEAQKSDDGGHLWLT